MISLAAAAMLMPSASTAKRAELVERVASHKAINTQVARQQARATHLRRGIGFYRRAAWHWEALAGRHIRSEFAERHVTSISFLRWELHLWRRRWVLARHYVQANPWLRMLRRTRAYRQCIIRYESANAGLYKAENGSSSASGAYQFLDGTWQSRLADAKRYFEGKLKGWWNHAADAPPKVQDVVAAYDIMADDGVDWTHPDCRAIGVAPA